MPATWNVPLTAPLTSVIVEALRVRAADIVPPVPLASETVLSPVTVTTAADVPVMLKLADETVPVQVRPAPQVRTPAADTATVEADAPATTVPKSRSDVLVTVICFSTRARAVAVAVAGAASAATVEKAAAATRTALTVLKMVLLMVFGPCDEEATRPP